MHEAHRHPWAERLVIMYMLKIRNGKEFGNRAGGCWRLIFVAALMPWIKSYKVGVLPEGIVRTPSESTPEGHKEQREVGVVDESPAPPGRGYENIRLIPSLS